MSSPPVGYFQIRYDDSIKYDIRKNHLISQTYIANFKGHNKIIVNLPWQFMLSKTINIYLDTDSDNSVWNSRVKNESKPEYLFINGTKVPNTGILDLTWAEILN